MDYYVRFKQSIFIKERTNQGEINPEAHNNKPLGLVIREIATEFKSITNECKRLYRLEQDAKDDENRRMYKSLRNKQKQKLPLIYVSHHTYWEDTALIHEPTGLFGGDIDLKDNPGIDVDLLKQELCSVPSMLYVFISPSGGIKFAVKTDFARKSDVEPLSHIVARYKQGYRLVVEELKARLSQSIVYDSNMESFYFKCFYSHDPHLYYNKECAILQVQNLTEYNPPVIVSNTNEAVSEDLVYYLLSFINKFLPYADWFRVSLAVFRLGGSDAFGKLMTHWSDPDKESLENGLKLVQSQKDTYTDKQVGIGTLYYYARQNPAFQEPRGVARKKHNIPKQIEKEIKVERVSLDEARDTLSEIYQAFFDQNNPANQIVAITTGSGKTDLLADFLIKQPQTNRYLIQVPTHDLADQLYKTLKRKKGSLAFRKRQQVPSFTKPQCGKTGKHGLCANSTIRPLFEKKEVPIPAWVCVECPIRKSCPYQEQFDRFYNIRIMTHEEGRGESSWFFNDPFNQYHDLPSHPSIMMRVKDKKETGENILIVKEDFNEEKYESINKSTPIESMIKVRHIKTGKKVVIEKEDFDEEKYEKPPVKTWDTTFQIIDENPIQTYTETLDMNSGYKSVRNIISQLQDDPELTLGQAILNNEEAVMEDIDSINDHAAKNPNLGGYSAGAIALNTLEQRCATFIGDKIKWQSGLMDKEMIRKFQDFVKNPDDKNIIKSIVKDIDVRANGRVDVLKFCRFRGTENTRHKNSKILILDATAHEGQCYDVYPDFKYKKILVKKHPSVTIRQCRDKTPTRNALSKGDISFSSVVEGLKRYIDDKRKDNPNYKVGFISYLNVKQVSDNFAELVGKQIGANSTLHFGAEVGVNDMEDFDLLIVFGRQYTARGSADAAIALYGDCRDDLKWEHLPAWGRMSDGTAVSWMSYQSPCDKLMVGHEIVGKTRTVQSSGRIRPLWANRPKEVLIFSNEGYGDELEIDEFFSWDDFFKTVAETKKEEKVIENVNESAKYRNDIPKCFQRSCRNILDYFGIKQKDWDVRRDVVFEAIEKAGYQTRLLKVRDKSNHTYERHFCSVSDEDLHLFLQKNRLFIVSK